MFADLPRAIALIYDSLIQGLYISWAIVLSLPTFITIKISSFFFSKERDLMASSSMTHPPQLQAEWSWSEEKIFEVALVQYPEGTPDRWSLITAKLPGKTLSQVLHHYEVLIYDLELIESGRVEILDYRDNEEGGGSSGKQRPPVDQKISFDRVTTAKRGEEEG